MRIFLVEDDSWYGKMLEHSLALNPDNTVKLFRSAEEIMAHVSSVPDLLVLDYHLPGTSGEVLMGQLRKRYPQCPVVIVSGQREVSVAVSLFKSGIIDYLTKDDDTVDRLWKIVEQQRELVSLREEVVTLRKKVDNIQKDSRALIGSSKAIQQAQSLMDRAARSDLTVIITGETGTGKEVAARAIHEASDRKNGPFVAINVAAIPAELLESELFGHEKGAFTGAINRRIGKFEEAQEGTLLLDEIGELNPTLQAKMLRVLQENEVYRIGSNQAIKLNVRVIAATHRNLLEEVAAGRFREDLYYRLFGFIIQMPPLRERGNDIVLLAKHFADAYCERYQKPLKSFHQDSIKRMLQYPFPGNVRELKSVVEMAIVLAEDQPFIDPHHLQMHQMPRKKMGYNPHISLRDVQATFVQEALEAHNYDIMSVTKQIGISRSTIYRMAKAGDIVIKT